MQMFNERMKARGQGGFTHRAPDRDRDPRHPCRRRRVRGRWRLDTADKKACEIEGKSVETAAQAFKADSATNSFPGSITNLSPTYMKDT